MKKILSAVLVVIMIAGLMSACEQEKTKEISVYFKDAQLNKLNEEKHSVEATHKTSTEDLAKLAVSEIIAGPKTATNAAVISSDAKLLSLVLNSGVATVNMSSHFSEKKGAGRLLLIFSFVNTLCSIDGISGVVIQVEGKPIIKESTGEEWGVLTMEDMTTNAENKTALTLYFPNKNADKLVSEKRTIDSQQALSLEKAIISELLKGPENKELTSAVANGTKLLDIETKDGICYVNFSSEFTTKSSSGSTATTLSLYAVVNSLCELDTVNSVQILVDGVAGVEYGNLVLDRPEEPNYDFVE